MGSGGATAGTEDLLANNDVFTNPAMWILGCAAAGSLTPKDLVTATDLLNRRRHSKRLRAPAAAPVAVLGYPSRWRARLGES